MQSNAIVHEQDIARCDDHRRGAFLTGLLETLDRLARKLRVKIGICRTVAVANPVSILGFEQQLDESPRVS